MTVTVQPFGPERGGSIAPTTKYLRPRGALHETFPRQFQNTVTPTTMISGTLWLTIIEIPSDINLNGITFVTDATALAAGTHQIFGLYDDDLGTSTGTPFALLAGTSDDTNAAWAINSVKALPFSAPYRTLVGGLYYIGIMVTAGTPPALVANSVAAPTMGSLPPVLGGRSSTGLTALPNPCIAPTANKETMLYGYVF